MAANYIVTNTRFKPFTYDELLKPVLRATEEHRNLEEQYANLATSANAPLGMLNEVLDSKSYKRNNDYLQDLENLADILAKEGISSSSRRSALQMKQRYASEILPIEQAIKRRQELVDQQRETLLKDDTSMFDTDASLLSVDALVNTPQYTYKALSGAALTKRVHDIVSSLSREGSDIPSEVKSILGDQYYELKRTGRFTHKDLEDASKANTTNEKAKLLRDIIDKAVASTGVNDWRNPNISKKARDYAYLGAYNAIGKDDYHIIQNRGYDSQQKKDDSPAVPINPRNIYSRRKLSEEEKDYNSNISNFSQYFEVTEPGKLSLTEDGWKEYKNTAKILKGKPKISPEGVTFLEGVETESQPSKFRQLIDTILQEGVKSKKYDENIAAKIGEAWNNYVTNSPVAKTAKYDAKKVTEFGYNIAPAQQEAMKQNILAAASGVDLKEVDYDDEAGTFVDIGSLKLSDLIKDEYKVVDTPFSVYGSTVLIVDENGNTRRFKMPSGINPRNEDNRYRALVAARYWQEVVNTGKFLDENGKTRDATPYEIALAEAKYEEALETAYLLHSQLLVQFKTKDQEFKPKGY